MNKSIRPLALTAGEPAGIGPDIVLQLLQDPPPIPLVIFADPHCLETRAKQLKLPLNLLSKHAHIQIEPIALSQPCIPGVLNINNARYVIQSIEAATQACMDKRCRAMVTAPVHKGIINEAGISFSGHTELLAALTNTNKTVMMLVTSQLKVALATTHLPLAKVSQAITEAELTQCIEIIAHDLQTRFQLPNPHITVCGLNPHAGESGHLGEEEIKIITPTLEKLRKKGYRLTGPLSADTAFTSHVLNKTDVILAMYHDQGLPVIKAQGFGEAVNVTLGLPIVRTSVDHGVALSLAGTGKASAESLKLAIQYADIL